MNWFKGSRHNRTELLAQKNETSPTEKQLRGEFDQYRKSLTDVGTNVINLKAPASNSKRKKVIKTGDTLTNDLLGAGPAV